MDAVRDEHSTIEVEQLCNQCTELAEVFATRAVEHDRDGTFPVENFRDLREAGLLGLMVPASHGGMGADYYTYTRAIECLAQGDASTALAFNMHSVVVGCLLGINLEGTVGRRAEALSACRSWVYEQALDGKLFASASSEPHAGPRLSKMTTRYERVDGGFVLNGVKAFVSMGGYADFYLAAAKSDQSFGEVPAVSYFLVDLGNPGVEFTDDWDVLGMRSTCSNTMTLKDCFLPTERLFLLEGVALYKSTREPHWLAGAYNGVYLGIADAIVNFTIDYLVKSGRVDDPVVQHSLGDMSVQLESARSATYEAAQLVTAEPGSPSANRAVHRAKYLVGEVGPELASQAIRLCGGGAISKRFPLERYYREARCGGLMPARSDECLKYLGKSLLGLDVTDPLTSYW